MVVVGIRDRIEIIVNFYLCFVFLIVVFRILVRKELIVMMINV